MVSISVMNRWFFYIFFGAAGVLIGGCREPEQNGTEALLDGIKIGDLRPTTSRSLPPEVHFMIFTFEMPAENFSLIEDIYERIQIKPLRFVNQDAFVANGFSAGFGRREMWNKISGRLELAKARKAATNTLMIFDEEGNEIAVAMVGPERTVFYTDVDGSVKGVSLIDGRFALGIKARPIAGIRGLAEVKIEPMFRPNVDNTIRQLVGRQKDERVVFESMSLNLKMGNSDFVLLGPRRYEPGEMTLGNMFFVFRGDFILPEPSEEKKGEVTITRSVTLKKDIALIRLYLIVCTRV